MHRILHRGRQHRTCDEKTINNIILIINIKHVINNIHYSHVITQPALNMQT